VQLGNAPLGLRRGRRGARRQKGSDRVHVVVHEDNSVLEGVGKIQALDLFEAFRVPVRGKGPTRPGIRVESNGKNARRTGKVGRQGTANAVTHADNLPRKSSTCQHRATSWWGPLHG
jgi:hypothetical protein